MIDRSLFLAAVTLIVTGIVFSYSLSAYTVLLYNVPPYHFLLRQLVAGVAGIVLMWYIARQNPKKVVIWLGFTLLVVSAFLMVATPFLPEQIAREVGGAKRWIRLGPVSLAPVEFFKVGFVFFLAWSFSRRVIPKHAARSEDVRYTLKEELLLLLPYIIVFAAIMFIIAIFQNDLGQVVVLAATLLFMMIFAGSSIRIFGFSILVGGLALAAFVVTSPHRIERFKGWWFMLQNSVAKLFPQWAHAVPKVNLVEEPYQVSNSLHAIHHGGLFGVGLGNGVLKLGFLSEVHTDFVLAGMAEEIGVVGVGAVVMLLLFIIFRLLRIAGRVPNTIYYLYCSGLAMIIGFAFLINALGISGVIPLKGIAVPFLSYGGSQVVALSIGIGLALSMSKEANL
ncbi:FtsW/RodA/SpoVE family cell cycle protein [Hydrogenimonas urashimensis]|uniref:FtsW/RodA/SpoVE family cell cycle protein n=1 Tax=Hydrogenimonas urashimensis TaxID=2740515 RepID=UPI001915FBB9|nr:FtsW/RodA/SpoVE family cell cycle protein [Hydrogenimonas urashimensis]